MRRRLLGPRDESAACVSLQVSCLRHSKGRRSPSRPKLQLPPLIKGNIDAIRRLQDDIALEPRESILSAFDSLVRLQNSHDGVRHLCESELLTCGDISTDPANVLQRDMRRAVASVTHE